MLVCWFCHKAAHILSAKLAIVGRLATDFLLEGAVQVYSKLPGRKEYQKFGTVRSALNDFYSVNPDNVRLTKLPNGVSTVKFLNIQTPEKLL